MDIESLAKELILKNMNPEQQLAVLDGIKASVAQAKEVQKQRIGENVGLVVDALKRIEADIRARYDEVGNAIEQRVASIKDGQDGRDGKDGRNGRDGRDGKQGVQGNNGKDGRDGRDGVDGIDGVSVTSARIDFDGSLIIGLSSGVELNVGEVVAPDLAESIKVITNGGGTSQSVLDTLASLQTQINNLIPSQTGNSGKFLTTNGSALSWASIAGGGLSYQGTWNASTNSPTLTSSVGTNGYYYVVSTSGSTNLNGVTDWVVGDWAMYNGSVWQKIDQTNLVSSVNGQTGAVSLTYTDVNAIGSITSADGSVTVSTASGVADLSVAVSASTTNVICQVRNTTGATLTKGTAVYISGATGQIPTVSKALATSDATSAQTLGLLSADLANNTNGYVTIIGLINDIDTSAYTDGAQLYLSGTTAGTLTSTKTYAPTHLVYVAVVEYAHAVHGKLFVKVQNGYELDEIHNVSAQSPSNGQTIIWNASTSLWEAHTLTAGAGVSVTNGAGSITVANTGVTSAVAGTGISVSGSTGAVTISNTGVTSVTGTSPVVSSGGATPAISLATGYGDTQNPYASKTANYFLAAPNGSSGAPTFRAVVAADIPTLNQDTTGTATNATNTAITNDTTTNATVYPTWVTSTSGNLPQKVSSTKLTFNPSTGICSTTGLNLSGLTASSAVATDSSKNLVSVTNTGSGNNVLATSPTITTPTISTITSASATALTLQSNGGTTAMTIDTSQNVGIGTTSISNKLEVNGTINIANGSSVGWGNQQTTITGNTSTNIMQFYTAAVERMRIDSSGNLIVNATAQVAQGKFGVAFVGSTNQAASFNETSGASSWTTVLFQRTGTTIGSITNATSSTAYNTSSDYRLKNTIIPMKGALAKVLQLKPVTYKWNIDNEDGEGFIAHELAEVCPHAVTGAKDAVDAGGNPVYQGIDTSFLVATLTAALQELKALVDKQATEIAELKAKVG